MKLAKQGGLFDEQQGNFFIKKHSALAQMNNITSLMQRKSINALLWIAKDILKRKPSEVYFEVDLGILKRLAGVYTGDNKRLKDGLKSLVSLVIEYNILNKAKDSNTRGAFPFLSFVQIQNEKRGSIAKLKFSLSPPIHDALMKPNMYVKLNLFLQRGFKSKYSLALLEVLTDYKGLGKLSMNIEDFKKLLGIEQHKYSVFASLKRKVIDIAVNEINEKSDLEISYELEKTGRKIGVIIFLISGKMNITENHLNKSHVINKLHFYGFNDLQVKNLIKTHDEDYILGNIGVVEEELKKGKKIRNVKAYLAKGFKINYTNSNSVYETEKQLKNKQKQKKLIQAEVKQTELLEKKKQFTQQKNKKVKAHLKNLSEKEIEALQNAFKTSIIQNPLFEKAFQSKGFQSQLIEMQWFGFIAKKVFPKNRHSFENYSQGKIKTPKNAV